MAVCNMRRAIAFIAVLVLCGAAAAAPAPDAPLPPDPQLQRSLEEMVRKLNLSRAAADQRLAISLVDVTNINEPRYAGVNDRHMMYAASLPKIAVLVAGFERIRAGLMEYTPSIKDMFVRMTRFSSNIEATKAIHKIGFDYIAQVLTGPKYRFYDPQTDGGLWLGKAYGGPDDRWRRDPLHNISHGATSLQVARFFVLLEQGQLVSPEYSAEIKDILSNPGIHHKFVKGLDSKPGCQIYRKSGTWMSWHSDAALVEHNGKKYVAVALMDDNRGAEIFPKLIVKVDDLFCGDE